MSKFQNQIGGLLFIILSTAFFAFSQTNAVGDPNLKDSEIAEKVKIAFEQAAKSNFEPLKQLKTYETKVVPYLEPYVTNSDSTIAYTAMFFIKDHKEPEYIPLFLAALQSSDEEISRNIALALYDNFDHQTLVRDAAVGDAVRRAVVNGNLSLSLFMLLGNFPESVGEKSLLSIPQTSKINFWTANQEIPFDEEILSTVPVCLSLYRINREKYRARFADLVKKATLGENEFLLYTLEYIDDPALLKMIFEKGIVSRNVLSSEAEFHGGYLASALRMNDLTVNQFARKLQLNFGFKLQFSRYTPRKIALARQKIAAKIAAL